jgi:hypothetical protein
MMKESVEGDARESGCFAWPDHDCFVIWLGDFESQAQVRMGHQSARAKGRGQRLQTADASKKGLRDFLLVPALECKQDAASGCRWAMPSPTKHPGWTNRSRVDEREEGERGELCRLQRPIFCQSVAAVSFALRGRVGV